MSLHTDLLDQGRLLAGKERNRPKQASLRRAVSAAYYSVFHLLVDKGSRFLVGGSQRMRLRHCISRAFAHREMKEVATTFSEGRFPRGVASAIQGARVSRELSRLAEAFVNLQQARHEADYDLSRRFRRRDVADLLDQAQQAHDDLTRIEGTPEADAFLVTLFAGRKIRA